MKKDFTKHPLKVFLSYFRPHVGLLILDLVCSVIVAAVDLVFPYVSKYSMEMLLPEKLSLRTRALICIALSALHGFCYGILYAPTQAILFGLNLKGTIAWIAAGFPFDLVHGISNLFTGLLILPLTLLLGRLSRQK